MSYLSKNIKYLRKLKRWNQTELAEQLGVKRGSIASYESKNVEPRLSLIVKIAKLFDVRLVDLIESDIALTEGDYRSFYNSASVNDEAGTHNSGDTNERLFAKINAEDYNRFMNKSKRMQKMLDGFHVFYKMKLDNYRNDSDTAHEIAHDIENFIILLEQLAQTNQYFLDHAIEQKASDCSS